MEQPGPPRLGDWAALGRISHCGLRAWWVGIPVVCWMGGRPPGPGEDGSNRVALGGAGRAVGGDSAPSFLAATIPGLGAFGLIGAYVPTVTMLNNWFRERLVLALALMLFGVGIAGVAVGPLMSLSLLVVDWRLLTVVCGAAILAAALPLVRAMRNRPED